MAAPARPSLIHLTLVPVRTIADFPGAIPHPPVHRLISMPPRMAISMVISTPPRVIQKQKAPFPDSFQAATRFPSPLTVMMTMAMIRQIPSRSPSRLSRVIA